MKKNICMNKKKTHKINFNYYFALLDQVNPLSKDAVVQQLGSMQVQLKDELDLALARADLSQVNEVALMYASLINMASKNGSAGYYA